LGGWQVGGLVGRWLVVGGLVVGGLVGWLVSWLVKETKCEKPIANLPLVPASPYIFHHETRTWYLYRSHAEDIP